ncbi:glycerophosphodiester phosphodiesterase [Rheinheimera riviphila]|uniref:Glycerophosphodiester phosphodiesterase n=1 Tax=Rheinheimera riviphila TaxID=1834037 RepID=A0A437QBD3_9GAMM|nr:glycerophosphodiester phosphodiesterase family protein [Rheinheimera riviphila]RVU31872.1 glycerophosphodiester phosphodiesterase [Rheinheimera riviphila]
MKIFAHRGVSGHFPENTLLAIQAALDCGAYGIEIDVFALDGELIVIHDRQLHRTTKAVGNIEDYTLAQLQQLNAGKGQIIPTLWQVLQLTNNRCVLNIELKGHDTAELLLQLLQRARQELATDFAKLLISSFHHPLLQQVKQGQPELAIGALTACIPLDYCAFATQLSAVSVHCDRAFIDEKMVQDAHQRGLEVFVYTVNDQREALRLQALGVDGIFCNFPAEAASWF